MSDVKWTPGPWKIGTLTNEHGTFNPSNVSDASDDGVCSVFGIALHKRLEDLTERDAIGLANARLIAAAPDLYEALKFAVSWIEDLARKDASHQMQNHKLDEMRAAIAKARGE